MPLVNVMVNSRAYTIACDEGEEEHLQANSPPMSTPRRVKSWVLWARWATPACC